MMTKQMEAGLLNDLLDAVVTPPLRLMREYAEQEIVIPTGDYKGLKFKCSRQPFAGLLFDAIDSGIWPRVFLTGPTQSGKTLIGSCIPVSYHLLELKETCVFGIPDGNMATDKWQDDLLPVIEKTRYAHFLPTKGPGSRGGSNVIKVTFGNGGVLRFMTGGGDDKQKAGYTASVLAITETDGMDKSGETSKEADRITQLEGRLMSKGILSLREYAECTVTVKKGRTWREITEGTDSKIMCLCPYCETRICPEREHLVGFENAENEYEAFEMAHWECPSCSHTLSEKDRYEANVNAVLMHRGQHIDEHGDVVGELPKTFTLGFRWSAFNNMFLTAGDVGLIVWKAKRDPDQENAEKKLCQFVFAVPHEPTIEDLTALDVDTLKRRQDVFPRGVIPPDAEHLAIGIDIGKKRCHWTAIAWRPDAIGYVVDYGYFLPRHKEMDEDLAIIAALWEFEERVMMGWPHGGEMMTPGSVWIDAGYKPNAIYRFCKDANDRLGKVQLYRPSIGFSTTKQVGKMGKYVFPKKEPKGKARKKATIRHIGDNYHLVKAAKRAIPGIHVNADHWKTQVHDDLSTPAGEPGSLQLFAAQRHEHDTFSRHLTAEVQKQKYIAGEGDVIVWERISQANHFLDSTYLARAAGHFVGVRVLAEPKPKPPPADYPKRPAEKKKRWKIGRE